MAIDEGGHAICPAEMALPLQQLATGRLNLRPLAARDMALDCLVILSSATPP